MLWHFRFVYLPVLHRPVVSEANEEHQPPRNGLGHSLGVLGVLRAFGENLVARTDPLWRNLVAKGQC